MPRFVILLHKIPSGSDRSGTHWDLMLEQDGSLRTWALQTEPKLGANVDALELADHRIDYLQYEGPVSGNRGEVSRWDEGSYQVAQESADSISVALNGRRLVGRVELVRVSDDEAETPQRWTFVLSPAD